MLQPALQIANMTQWHPHKTVATVVEKNGLFLMVEELIDGEIVYNQPAGHLEDHETLEEAAVRETLEETAWLVKPVALLGLYQHNAANGICYIRSCFIATTEQHFPERLLDADILRAVWMSRADLENCREQLRSPVVLKVIDDYLDGRRYPLDVIQQIP